MREGTRVESIECERDGGERTVERGEITPRERQREKRGTGRMRDEVDRSRDRGAYVVERKFRKESFFHPRM